MKNIKSNKELSLGTLIDKGLSKDEILKLKGMTSAEYDRALASLMKIREDAEKGLLPSQQKKRYKGTGVSKKWEN